MVGVCVGYIKVTEMGWQVVEVGRPVPMNGLTCVGGLASRW